MTSFDVSVPQEKSATTGHPKVSALFDWALPPAAGFTHSAPDLLGLDRLHIAIVGGGPGGLLLASTLRGYGAKVTLYEKTGDPRQAIVNYHYRSFNFTLNDVGRAELGDPLAWDGGTQVVGRAAHLADGSVRYAPYDGGQDGLLTSLPRDHFRRNLTAMAERNGARLHFDTEVTRLDPDSGRLWTTHNGSLPVTVDLVVAADGLDSLVDDCVATLPDGATRTTIEPRRYVTGTVPRGEHNLSLQHLHFFHHTGSEAYAVGMPNHDGSMTFLLISPFAARIISDIPFVNAAAAAEYLDSNLPQLATKVPTLAPLLAGRRYGLFHYKTTSHFAVGNRLAIIGDAGGVRPPWAGFGANLALYGAGSLTRCLVAFGGDTTAALPHYQTFQLVLADLVRSYIQDHGKFLSQHVSAHPEMRSRDALGELIQLAYQAVSRTERSTLRPTLVANITS
jgi:2-polyprenyl-6-methoxyphenol hydroxylase-like FAD-dependent oxidoreductase